MHILPGTARQVLLPFLLLFLALIALSNRTTAQSIETPTPGGTIVLHMLYGPETLNLITVSDAIADEIHSYIYETLTKVDPFTLDRIPWIAESLPTLSPDRMSYEFTIRKDVRFSDGEPVTGEDFIFYLKTVKNPRILRATPTRVNYERVDSAELIDGDPYRLRVVMRAPYFIGDQWVGDLYAFPKHAWDPNGISDRISFAELSSKSGDYVANYSSAVDRLAERIDDATKGFDPDFLIGSGPYVLGNYVQSESLVLQRNTRYWNQGHKYGKAYPDRLVWKEINDFEMAFEALEKKEIDVLPRMIRQQWSENRESFSESGMVSVEYSYPAYNYLGYNVADTAKPFLSDHRVRTAFAYALDRKRMMDEIYFGMATQVQSPIYSGRPEYDSTLPLIPFDLSKAAALLDEAGWKDSDGDGVRDKMVNGKRVPMEFKILLNKGNVAREEMASIFIAALKQIGVEATSESVEWAAFLHRLDRRQYEAYIGGWVGSVVEVDLYPIWHSESSETGGSNYVSFKNPRVDALIEAIRTEFDFDKRKEMFREIQQIIHREQPYNFLVSEIYAGAYLEHLKGIEFFAPRPCYNAAWWWIPESKRWR